MLNIYGTSLPYRPSEKEKGSHDGDQDADAVQELVDFARSGHGPPPDNYAPYGRWSRDIILQAIDDNGNSVLQLVCRHAPVNVCAELVGEFHRALNPPYSCTTPWRPPPPFQRWSSHAFLVHNNNDGDTFLHDVARTGSQSKMIMAHRLLLEDGSFRSPEISWPDSIERKVWGYREEDDGEYTYEPLMALLTTNNAGRDVAAEARFAGHETLAKWVDDAILRLDPEGRRRTDAGKKEILECLKQDHLHQWLRDNIDNDPMLWRNDMLVEYLKKA